jgi:hypothetical protein
MVEAPKLRPDIATRFQKGNEAWKKAQHAGKPEVWTEEVILVLCANLIEWMDKDTSICFAGFLADNYITYQTITYLRNKFPEFESLYNLTRTKIATRLATKVGKDVHVEVFKRYQAVYDDGLKSHEKEMANTKREEETEDQKIAHQKAIETSGKIHEQIKEYLDRSSQGKL